MDLEVFIIYQEIRPENGVKMALYRASNFAPNFSSFSVRAKKMGKFLSVKL